MTLIAQPFKCSSCGAYRDSDGNHWWLVQAVSGGPFGPRIELMLWNEELARQPRVEHCCGIACAIHQISSRASDLIGGKS